jgi:hypothetical protein
MRLFEIERKLGFAKLCAKRRRKKLNFNKNRLNQNKHDHLGFLYFNRIRLCIECCPASLVNRFT